MCHKGFSLKSQLKGFSINGFIEDFKLVGSVALNSLKEKTQPIGKIIQILKQSTFLALEDIVLNTHRLIIKRDKLRKL